MDSISNWNWNLIVANALRRGDDEAHDQSIAPKVEDLLHAAFSEKNRKVAEIANNPRVHEIIEVEVIRPAVVLIGK
jgi:hypothetical protein